MHYLIDGEIQMGLIEWILTAIFIIFVGLVILHAIMKKDKTPDDMMHYYMFSVEDANCIVYVSTKDKIKSGDMDDQRVEVGKRFDLSKESSLNIGISYIGYFSENEMSKRNKK